MTDTTKKITESLDEMGNFSLSNIKLEDADPRLLDVREMELDEHVAIQPAAVAYYGALLKQSKRMLETHKRTYEKWHRRKYAEAKAALKASATKPTIEDIEARLEADNEHQMNKYEETSIKLQAQNDTLSSWYDGWKQKSFTIREFAQITEDERWNSNDSISGGKSEKNDFSRSSSRVSSKVRDMIKNRKTGQ